MLTAQRLLVFAGLSAAEALDALADDAWAWLHWAAAECGAPVAMLRHALCLVGARPPEPEPVAVRIIRPSRRRAAVDRAAGKVLVGLSAKHKPSAHRVTGAPYPTNGRMA